MRRFLQPPKRPSLHYLKNLPFHLNQRSMYKMRIVGQFLGIVILTAVIAYTVLNNFAPLGITAHYSLMEGNNNNFELGPKDRINKVTKDGQTTIHQTHDLIYFTTDMPFYFDKATVRLTFKNPDPNQTISLGFHDQNIWHYDTQVFDVPYLNNLSWVRTGDAPILYQRKKYFNNVDDFFKNPPKDVLIGTYAYDTTIGDIPTKISDYEPATQETIIDTPLRGKHILYAYLENEPFSMTIQKQDLNWYEDPDTMTVNVYKDQNLVFQVIADDDGISDNSKKTLPPQEIEIKNPGPDLPENGVYKIVIEATGDTIIKNIKTNLHKIVFANSIFPAANNLVYWPTVTDTIATTLYTNALILSGTTYHGAGLQNIFVDNHILPITGVKNFYFITPQEYISKIVVPQSDVILNGFQAFFSFNQDQFFDPTPYHIVPINSKSDVDLVDYIVTDYIPSETNGQWQTAERTFDIHSAFIKDKKLSWVIVAPKLQENNREIIIGDIDITLYKNPWL